MVPPVVTLEELAPELSSKPCPEPGYRSVEDAGPGVNGFSSGSAQATAGTLRDEPAPTNAIADRIETSHQSVRHHPSRLEDSGSSGSKNIRTRPKLLKNERYDRFDKARRRV